MRALSDPPLRLPHKAFGHSWSQLGLKQLGLRRSRCGSRYLDELESRFGIELQGNYDDLRRMEPDETGSSGLNR